jgi:hypothetical protein
MRIESKSLVRGGRLFHSFRACASPLYFKSPSCEKRTNQQTGPQYMLHLYIEGYFSPDIDELGNL